MPTTLKSSVKTSTTPPHKPLTLLHTSDWHLGRRLYGRMRYEEFEAFLNWLTHAIKSYQVDVVIVAGDVFDTMTPSNRAQALYYQFLGTVAKSDCQHIVIVAGNHDSPTFLDAPSYILKFLNVHVIGTACEDVSDEVLVLNDINHIPQCIITAVPYLRDRDVRTSMAGESERDKDANVIEGIRSHYAKVADIAKAKQDDLKKTYDHNIPIIATGHLFTAGGKTTDDDGVRDLYVGTLGKVSADMFDDCFDYVALGHLHVPQKVGGREHIRYSGSPIPMGFGEARQQKQVLLIQFGDSEHDGINSAKPLKAPLKEPLKPNTVSDTKSKPAKSNPKNDADIADLFDFIDERVELDERVEFKTDNTQIKPAVIDTVNMPAQPNPNTNFKTQSAIEDKLAPYLLHHNSSNSMRVLSVPIPCFQKLANISGDFSISPASPTSIEAQINELAKDEAIWLEVLYTGQEIVPNLRERINELVADTPFEVLKTRNPQQFDRVLRQQKDVEENLTDLDEVEVFERCLQINGIGDGQKEALRTAYTQIIYDIHHDDKMAE